jgi:hypothetical protein
VGHSEIHSAKASTRDDRSKPSSVLLALTGHSNLLDAGIYNEGGAEGENSLSGT